MYMKINRLSAKTALFAISAAAILIGGVHTLMPHASSAMRHLHGVPASDVASADVTRVRAEVAALGKRWNANVEIETAKLYATLLRQHDDSGIERISSVSYGPDSQQTFDLFAPNQGFDELGTVVIFLHDGNDKIVAGSDGLVYSNVAKFAARFGGVGLSANYRSAGFSGVQDVRALIEWARANVSRYGGDPELILILGNGQGAAVLVSYLFDEKAQIANGPGIAGAILGAGTFDDVPASLVDSYEGKQVPMLLWSAELDPVASGVTELRDQLCRKYGSCPMYAELEGHNHGSPVMSLDSADMSVTNLIIQFYHDAIN